MHSAAFHPGPFLLDGMADSDCRAVVVLPVRDERTELPACLDSLAAQTDENGRKFPRFRFEILLLLNNCSDDSAAVAQRWRSAHPDVCLHIVECRFPASEANVGTARRLLMDTAWYRLSEAPTGTGTILSTDADTVLHPKWISRNLRAIAEGADAVGGRIRLHKEQLQKLPKLVQSAYESDRRYQSLVARFEDVIDPQKGDRWPRHLDHFGASLACTREVYALAGGLPAMPSLEDAAFVDALRRIDANVRHDPSVQVFTSARLKGRTGVGFSGQLRIWSDMKDPAMEHRVHSAAFLQHRFSTLASLRRGFFRDEGWEALPSAWHGHLRDAASRHALAGQFLAAIDCDALIEQSFRGQRESPIGSAISELENELGLDCEADSEAMQLTTSTIG